MSTFTSDPGTRLGGRYRLEDRVAAAGGWAAWKAIDEPLARAVAVLTFAPGFPRVREVVTAARAASRLTDSRLAQVFDVEDDWDHAYVVMEWAAGDSLVDLLAEGPLEPAAGARMVAEAAAALSVAHAAGLAHLCLSPDSLRWMPGGGVKVLGLGIDAALSGVSVEDPALADTGGLGRLLYATLTGLWPGPDYPMLPPAPLSDGQPRSPRQVRAGVPAALDDVTRRVLQLRGSEDAAPLTTPGQLAGALATALPPEPLPPTAADRGRPRRADSWRQADGPGWDRAPTVPPAADGARPRRRRGSRLKLAIAGIAAVVVLAAIIAASFALRHPSSPGHPSSGGHRTTAPRSAVTVIKPVSAHGFDPLNLSDAGDENNSLAGNVLISNSPGWHTQEYANARFGSLKSGTGLILDLGRAVRLSSVTVTFGSVGGGDVQLKIGNSNTRSAANLHSMTTVAHVSDAAATQTFTVHSTASGRYLVIWFTKLPLDQSVSGPFKYMAQIFSIIVRGSASPS